MKVLTLTSSARAGFVISLLGLALGASASYELLAIPSADNTLRRIDPLSGNTLGSIALPPNTRSVQLDRITGYGFALAGGWVHRFDYSTGERAGAWNLGTVADISLSPNGGTLLAMNGANLRSFRTTDFSLLSNRSLPAVFGTPRSLTYMTSGILTVAEEYAFSATNNLGVPYTTDLATLGLIGVFGTAFGLGSAITVGKVAAVPLPGGISRVVVPNRTSAGEMRVNTTRFNAAGDTVGSENFVPSGFATGTGFAISAVASHGGFYLIGPGTGGGTRVEEYEGSSLALLSARNYGFAIPTGYFGAASVVAPEPGTLLALGAGLASLVARRRRRSSRA